MKRFALLAATALVAAVAVPASATLLMGQTIQLTHEFPGRASFDLGPVDYTVGTSSPASYFGIADISANDTQFIINVFCGSGCNWSPATFNGFALYDTYNTVAAFTSVTINGATSYAGFDASRITFTGDEIAVDLNGLTANGTITLDINGTVPETSTWAMLIAGFGLVGASLRRRKAALAA